VAWDRLSASALARAQDGLVRQQLRHAVAPFSPYWKARLADLGVTSSSVDGVAGLERIPAVGERDVSPSGDAAGMAALVLQAGESGFALHAPGPSLRRALRQRLLNRDSYRRTVETDTKPTSYVWSGLGFHYPLASTRGDLDVIARAGARLWSVLGLTPDDAVLSAVPVGATTEHVALQYAALATGTPALFPGDERASIAAAGRLAPATVIAIRSARAGGVLEALEQDGAELGRLRTVVLVGAPTDDERAAATEALGARAGQVTVLAVHAPAGARVLWGECRESGATGGFHTYPDIDVVQLVDPETGEPAAAAGEVVLTQLGLRGSALLRWRTGDVTADRVDASTCDGCGRTVARIRSLRRHPLVLTSDTGRALDLRSVAGALTSRPAVRDWRVVVGRRARDGRGQVVVHLCTEDDPAQTAVSVAADIRAVAGVLPTQIVTADGDAIAAVTGEPLTRRILLGG
jgi:phenylacetate-coenzyme A ligase PaaK-like adenylate-forming protein